eukprot:jgi/Undpi1/4748/HiC_scaffold_18.g08101.m1
MGTEGGRGAGEREMEDGNGRGSGHTPEAGRCAFEVDGWSQNPFRRKRLEAFYDTWEEEKEQEPSETTSRAVEARLALRLVFSAPEAPSSPPAESAAAAASVAAAVPSASAVAGAAPAIGLPSLSPSPKNLAHTPGANHALQEAAEVASSSVVADSCAAAYEGDAVDVGLSLISQQLLALLLLGALLLLLCVQLSPVLFLTLGIGVLLQFCLLHHLPPPLLGSSRSSGSSIFLSGSGQLCPTSTASPSYAAAQLSATTEEDATSAAS